MRLALIWGHNYDDKLATTHHTYWEATLRDRGIKFDRFTWTDWLVHMRHIYDLYFFIDFHPSLYQLHDKPFHPRCYFVWDSFHLTLTMAGQVTEVFDRSYMAEYNTAKGLQNQGLTTVRWLPPAFYEGIYKPHPAIEKDLDFAFVGQPDNDIIRCGHTRKEFVEKLARTYKGVVEQGVYGDKVNALYNRSRILFDRTIYNNVGTRVFETIGSGGFVMVNRGRVPTGIDELAINGHHYVSYDDSYEDFVKKFDYYLAHPDERARIAAAGHKHFLENHTYSKRLDVILKDFGLLDAANRV